MGNQSTNSTVVHHMLETLQALIHEQNQSSMNTQTIAQKIMVALNEEFKLCSRRLQRRPSSCEADVQTIAQKTMVALNEALWTENMTEQVNQSGNESETLLGFFPWMFPWMFPGYWWLFPFR